MVRRRGSSSEHDAQRPGGRSVPLLVALVIVLAVVLGALITRTLLPAEPPRPTVPAQSHRPAAPTPPARGAQPVESAVPAEPAVGRPEAPLLPSLDQLEAAPYITGLQLIDWDGPGQPVAAELHDGSVLRLDLQRRWNLRATVSRQVPGLHVHFVFNGEASFERLASFDCFGSEQDSGRRLTPGEHTLLAIPCVLLPLTASTLEIEACGGTQGAGRQIRFRVLSEGEPP